MGLDMYLERHRSTYERVKSVGSEIGGWDGTHYVMTEVYTEYAYWRKFNALHNFIVREFAEGRDECQRIMLGKEQVDMIYSILKEVMKDRSQGPVILPTGSGFFFGSTDYNDSYWYDVTDALTVFGRAVREIDFREESLTYRASW